MKIKDEIIQKSLTTALDWDRKKNPNWASRGYSTAMLAMLSKAVIASNNLEQAVEILVNSGARNCLKNIFRTFHDLQNEIYAGNLPWEVFGGNYNLIVFSHIATLLNEKEIAIALAEIANKDDVLKLATRFWAIYAQCLDSLFNERKFEIPVFRPRKGLEEYWFQYLHLMGMIERGQNATNCLEEISLHFLERNANAKIKDDLYEIEGSGNSPVRWDFRREAILKIRQ